MSLPEDRTAARLAWARQVLGHDDLSLAPASTDASARSYWRARDGDRSWIVMDSPPALEDPRPWLAIDTRLAAAGLHVPAVYAHDLQQGFLLIEDFGSGTYLDRLDERSADALYGTALAALRRMQTAVEGGDLPAYDRAFLASELELMPTWFLRRHLGCTPACEEWDILEDAFTTLLHAALEQPRCFVHRDYHSRNLLALAPGADPAADPPWQDLGIIDFQGAMYGPITYDLVSLLRDSYIAWDEQRVAAWAEGYRRQLLETRWRADMPDQARFRRWFDEMGLQRHIKILGIFCRLHYRDGKSGYLGDLPRVHRYVDTVAGRYPELQAFAGLLRRCIGTRDLRVPASP